MQSHYDLIIIGAGLVGTSLAAALQNQGLKIAILERHLPSFLDDNANSNSRPLALAYSSYRILQTLNLWSNLQNFTCPVNKVHVTEQGRYGQLCFEADEFAVSALGYVIPMAILHKVLYQQTAEQPEVDFISIQELQAIETTAEGAKVSILINGAQRQLSAELLVGADGTESATRRLAKIAVKRENLGETAKIINIHLENPHRFTAYERFSKQGIFALLPLAHPQQMRLVWAMSDSQYQGIAWQQQQWHGMVRNCFSGYLGSFQLGEMEASFILQTVEATEVIRPSLVLLGNSAHTLYPLAAQGFNLAFRDVAYLAEVLIAARLAKQSLGNFTVLQQYLRHRQLDQQRTQKMVRGLNHFFNLDVPLLGRLRGLGLMAANLITPIKQQIAHQAMGLTQAPSLVRGVALT